MSIKKGANAPFSLITTFTLCYASFNLQHKLLKGENYQILTRFSGAIYIASPSFTSNAL